MRLGVQKQRDWGGEVRERGQEGQRELGTRVRNQLCWKS